MKYLLLTTIFLINLKVGVAQEFSLRGVVIDESTKKSIAAARVSIVGGTSMHTTSSGEFAISLPPKIRGGDSVKVRVEKQYYQPVERLVIIPNNSLANSLTIEIRRRISTKPTPYVKKVPKRDSVLSEAVTTRVIAMGHAKIVETNNSVEIDLLGSGVPADWKVVNVSPSINGVTVENISKSKVRYTPPRDFVGKDSFSYTISDRAGNTDTANVVIEVISKLPEKIAPIPAADEIGTDANTPVEIDVLANDKVVNGKIVSIPAKSVKGGSVRLAPNGKVQYTPPNNFYGQDTFTYTVKDKWDATATSTVTVFVEDPKPNVQNIRVTLDKIEVVEDGSRSGTEWIFEILVNDNLVISTDPHEYHRSEKNVLVNKSEDIQMPVGKDFTLRVIGSSREVKLTPEGHFNLTANLPNGFVKRSPIVKVDGNPEAGIFRFHFTISKLN